MAHVGPFGLVARVNPGKRHRGRRKVSVTLRPYSFPREAGTHQTIHANSLLRRSNGQGTVRIRRHAHHELPAVGPVCHRLWNRLSIGLHVVHAVGHEALDARQGFCRGSRQPA